MIPYGRQLIDDADIAAVTAVLRSDWLTTGPKVEEFERALAATAGAAHAVAVSNGTAALHVAMFALGIGPGDEVVTTPMTFAASAACVLYQGGTPVFADVDADTLLLDPAQVARRLTERTKAVVAVDYAGQPCDYEALRAAVAGRDIAVVADSCHALGARYRDRPVGSVADLTAFSFHPVKHITTAEGGAVTTNDPGLAERMRRFRNHGISADHRRRAERGSWVYEVEDLGYNYRLSDVHCALGISQLAKLPGWLDRRRAIAARYDEAFAAVDGIAPLALREDVLHPSAPPSALRAPHSFHAYHLYVVRIAAVRDAVFTALREAGIGVNVHYVPVHLHPLYRERLGTGEGLCPVAEQAYREILSLPLYPALADDEVETVIEAVREAVESAGEGREA